MLNFTMMKMSCIFMTMMETKVRIVHLSLILMGIKGPVLTVLEPD